MWAHIKNRNNCFLKDSDLTLGRDTEPTYFLHLH